jgi:hypothetical protein
VFSLAIAAEEAAPAWVPVVALAIPVVIMLLVGVPAFRRRARVKRARTAQEERLRETHVDIGSAGAIADPSDYGTDALLKAMAVRPADYGPTGDMPYNEGWAGTMLGLKARMSDSTNVLEPHVYWGVRGLGQVFIRVGPDEKIEGGTTMLSNRHVRAITVLRVDAPSFQIRSDDGTLRVAGAAPAEIEDLVTRLATSVPTWSDTRITGGPDGIVASRDAIDGIENSWAYDLWLLERIAERLALVPLRDARVGPAWKVPYGLGRSQPK